MLLRAISSMGLNDTILTSLSIFLIIRHIYEENSIFANTKNIMEHNKLFETIFYLKHTKIKLSNEMSCVNFYKLRKKTKIITT